MISRNNIMKTKVSLIIIITLVGTVLVTGCTESTPQYKMVNGLQSCGGSWTSDEIITIDKCTVNENVGMKTIRRQCTPKECNDRRLQYERAIEAAHSMKR